MKQTLNFEIRNPEQFHSPKAIRQAGTSQLRFPSAIIHSLSLVACQTLALGLTVARAESFVQNADERARIEQALPAKAVVQPLKPRRLLIFTLNVGYGGHPSIAYANEAFTLMGRKTGAFETTVSNDPAVFQRDSLKQFDADCDKLIQSLTAR